MIYNNIYRKLGNLLLNCHFILSKPSLSYICERLVSFPVSLFLCLLLKTTNIYTYKTIYNGKDSN